MTMLTGLQIRNRMEAMRALTLTLPMNEYGLPLAIYRSDLLPFDEWEDPALALSTKLAEDAEESVQLVENEDGVFEHPALTPSVIHRIAGFPSTHVVNASVALNYDEGYPAFDDGQTFWSQLHYEPAEAYEAFQRYLTMSYGRAPNPEDDDDIGEAATAQRSISDLALSYGGNDGEIIHLTEKMKLWFHEYYWGHRAKAYDFYKIAAHRKQQEMRAIETNDHHYFLGRTLVNKAMAFIEAEEDFFDMLTPKTAIDLLKMGTQLERLASGQGATAPAAAKEGSRSQTLELHMRSVAQDSNPQGETLEHGESFEEAYDDPELLDDMQELIVRMKQ